MKKLKQMSGPYSIGFELSSTAHGFVATDPNGNVLYHGKQPVMGTRVFKEGQHAAEARMPRTSRRGIQRRRGREHEMERVFAPVISSIDPDFFIRRRMSYKLGKIRFESDPIGFSYSRLFHSFPTLAHLDVALMEADSAMDPRLIFEAVANHVVRRGHFLLENQNVSSTNSDIDTQVANYAEVLVSYFEDTLDERIELSLEALDINGNVTARELDATVRKQAEADRYAAEQKADAELYTRTKNAEAAKVEAQNKSDADLYSAQKTAEGVSAKAKAEAEATRLKGEADGAAEKAHGEGVAAGIKAQTEAYNGMENAYLLANRYIDVMPEVAEAVAKPLTAVDSIKMYGDGNATKLVRDTTGMVDQVTSGLKDATGIDLTELLSSFHQPFQPREDNE